MMKQNLPGQASPPLNLISLSSCFAFSCSVGTTGTRNVRLVIKSDKFNHEMERTYSSVVECQVESFQLGWCFWGRLLVVRWLPSCLFEIVDEVEEVIKYLDMSLI